MASVAYGSLPFEEQIAFFRAKRGVLTESYLDVFGAEHDTAFMVAGANRDALLGDFRQAIDAAIADGETLEEFRTRFDAIVETHGWDYQGGRNWRSRVIYETNLRQSYNAGTWAQLQHLKRDMPYWQYKHSDAVEHPRPLHLAWDGLVLHANDPWWHTHFPANGWGCQCSVRALSERDLKKLGKSGPDKAPAIDWQSVTIGKRSPSGPREVRTPAGVDPGFGYAPGRSLGGGPMPPIPGRSPSLTGMIERTAQFSLAALDQSPALQAAQRAAEILAKPEIAQVLDAGFAEWYPTAIASRHTTNRSYTVGAIGASVVEKLIERQLEPKTIGLVLRDREAVRAIRDSKVRDSLIVARAMTPQEWVRLPRLLRSPRAVLFDVKERVLLYVLDASDRREIGKVIVEVNYRLKLDRGKEVVNSIRSGGLVDLVNLRSQINRRLIVLEGSLD